MYAISLLKCYDASFLPDKLAPSSCFTASQFACKYPFDTEFYSNGKIENCYGNCPQQCATETFSWSASAANYPSSWYINKLSRFGNLENVTGNMSTDSVYNKSYLSERLLMVNVFYGDLSYVHFTESPAITSDTLLANIGMCLH